ncbi:hypothetical protein ACHAWO_010195 [Cyclotella atomus]|uniref:PH domain-containing protein n=1 Tax=Cyclotella atomus TaxID=382360 RepID=A0ABD3NC89_9STRA
MRPSRQRHVTMAPTRVPQEDYGNTTDDTRKDPDYWRVNFPSEELENLMWGGAGAPVTVSSPTWAKREADHDTGEGTEDSGVHREETNISMAIDTSKTPDVEAPHDEVILEDIVWKQRSGFGKYYMGILNHEWEQRRVALFASGKLRYYTLVANSPETAAKSSHSDQNPWEFSTEPRGEWLLNSRVKVKARRRSDNPGPTPFEIDVIQRDTNDMWRFCFISQSIQSEWMSYFKSKTKPDDDEECSDDSDDDDDELDDDELNNHGLKPGDHIIRWEMLPIIYPIQIHGIVLEAGKNVLVIADFGLTSHASLGGNEELNTFEDDNQSQDLIMQTWEKIKPKEKKRLNIIAITDPKEIRKWSKISYGDRVEENEKEKKGFLKSLLGGKSSPKTKKKKTIAKQDGAGGENQQLAGAMDNLALRENKSKEASEAQTDKCAVKSQDPGCNQMQIDEPEIQRVEGEPEWFYSGYRTRARTSSSDAPIIIDGGQSVFNVDHPVEKMSNLPKSDSAKLVLARTHFILENEDLLPPYHIFYSNSECLAVWCKTGRWSTLQAAVYLCSSAFGMGKSATMLSMSIAAAHMVLLPALAVGSLAVVGAPLLFLKKSQSKWDQATMKITEEFWSRAEPEVFVEAIEYWGGLK